MLTTDHYRVTDWQALEALLAAQPDVEGDRKKGWGRFTPLEGKFSLGAPGVEAGVGAAAARGLPGARLDR